MNLITNYSISLEDYTGPFASSSFLKNIVNKRGEVPQAFLDFAETNKLFKNFRDNAQRNGECLQLKQLDYAINLIANKVLQKTPSDKYPAFNPKLTSPFDVLMNTAFTQKFPESTRLKEIFQSLDEMENLDLFDEEKKEVLEKMKKYEEFVLEFYPDFGHMINKKNWKELGFNQLNTSLNIVAFQHLQMMSWQFSEKSLFDEENVECLKQAPLDILHGMSQIR